MVAVSAQTQQLRALKATLQGLDREGKRALGKTLSAAVDPLRDDFTDEAISSLPSRGGLGVYVAKSRFVVRRRLGGSRPTLAIRVRRSKRGGAVDLTRIEEGRLRHPVYGDRRTWVNQSVKAGMWDRVTGRAVVVTAARLSAAVDDAIKSAVR